jgi:hypothetical protein
MAITPSEFMSAQYGAQIKPAGNHPNIKLEGIAPNVATGITISVLKNYDGVDVLANYIGGNTLLMPNFIRATPEDRYFSEITFAGGTAQFIYSI